ncbi:MULTISPECIES: signal peptidase II [Amycolatopsis]|uniref:signal peptidase II n=1 Tax=Amycolatopsis TaxID=1813 RepID=UPI0033BD1F8D
MTDSPARKTARANRVRLALAATAVLLAALDLGLKIWAERALADGSSVDLALIDLRLAFNSGVAFSLGDSLPGGVVLGVAGLVIAGLVVFAWKAARTATALVWTALAAVLAGAAGNLADRAVDGVVTDYLHTGWFPTFNLADVFITVGAAVLVLASLRNTDSSDSTARPG